MHRGFLPGPPYEPILGPLTRLPVAWLLLQPSRAAARHQQPGAGLAVPVQINLTLPDYLVPGDAFDRGMRVEWRPADRFRMASEGGSSAPAQVRSSIACRYLAPWRGNELESDTGSAHCYILRL